MPTILVVEDDPKLAAFLSRMLREEGYDVRSRHTVAHSVAEVASVEPDVVIVDRMLPDGDGLDVCRALREQGRAVPILMLTALGELSDRVAGLDSGADDYVVKPFELDELLARLRALLRRSTAPVRSAGPLRIDLRSRRVWSGEAPVDLTPRELDLLAHLVEAEGAVLSRARLLLAVWGVRHDPRTGLVEVHISRLRAKLGAAAWTIETVKGSGYRFRREPSE